MTQGEVRNPTAANVNLRQVGRPLVRTDAPGKAFGRTRYADDHTMPDMLHATVLRAPLASARLVRLDATRARALPGVACVLTGADLADKETPVDLPGQTGQQRLDTDTQILVKERVRYQGEPLALIAAETIGIAEQAKELIDFELEETPGVYDPLEAMKPGAPVVQGTDNVVGPFGAKGIGEPAISPVAPAIANAIDDAIGVRIRELPITAEKIVMALRRNEAAG